MRHGQLFEALCPPSPCYPSIVPCLVCNYISPNWRTDKTLALRTSHLLRRDLQRHRRRAGGWLDATDDTETGSGIMLRLCDGLDHNHLGPVRYVTEAPAAVIRDAHLGVPYSILRNLSMWMGPHRRDHQDHNFLGSSAPPPRRLLQYHNPVG